jgi:hypothetical protein
MGRLLSRTSDGDDIKGGILAREDLYCVARQKGLWVPAVGEAT